ncbi:cAMP-dependent protein kinase inhibitor gamma isoform X3 [Marmota monax]|uniref:cAMP-dependent protein kinase inhibitor gamma isoform X3 n=1 Tax=Marmota monax TaxID=9995 RepID=UPI0026F1E1BE|nr:cAMP-dependent protein kinase inhibitor gamma isoform X3 [Marmota monax]
MCGLTVSEADFELAIFLRQPPKPLGLQLSLLLTSSATIWTHCVSSPEGARKWSLRTSNPKGKTARFFTLINREWNI